MNENFFTAIIIVATFSLIFRDKLKKIAELPHDKRKALGWASLRYLALTLFGLFIVVSFPPPWSFPPIVTTLYSILGMNGIKKRRLLHLISSMVVFAIGVALFNNAVVIGYEKNEIFLFGH